MSLGPHHGIPVQGAAVSVPHSHQPQGCLRGHPEGNEAHASGQRLVGLGAEVHGNSRSRAGGSVKHGHLLGGVSEDTQRQITAGPHQNMLGRHKHQVLYPVLPLHRDAQVVRQLALPIVSAGDSLYA